MLIIIIFYFRCISLFKCYENKTAYTVALLILLHFFSGLVFLVLFDKYINNIRNPILLNV